MGCGGSKVDDLPLVIRCRERKELIKAAADHRFTLAAAHLAYFHSLKDVGDALRRFVDEELVFASPSASPVLALPSDEGKPKKKNKKKHKISSSSTSLSHSGSGSDLGHIHLSEDEHDGDGSHLNLSSDSDSELDSIPGHIHTHRSPEIVEEPPYSSPPPQPGWGSYGFNPPGPEMGWGPYGVYPPPQTAWGSYGAMNPPPETDWGQLGVNSTTHTYYMKRSSPQIQSVIYDPRRSPAVAGQGGEAASYSYLNSYSSYPYENAGFFGYPMPSPAGEPRNQQPPAGPPPPPSPKVSTWDFFNPFDLYDSGYNGYYPNGKYGYGSIASSPDSSEVREREGIPDLEDETEPEVIREVHKEKKLNERARRNSGEGTSSSRAVPSQKQSSERNSRNVPFQMESSGGSSGTVPLHGSSEGKTRGIPSQSSEGTSREVPSQYDEAPHSVDVKEDKSSPDTLVSKSTEDGSVRKKGVTFEVDEVSTHDIESSKLSTLTQFSAHGTRDLQEVVAEIRDEFASASSYGKEVAMLLEVGKLPYRPRFTLLKVILSRLCIKAPPLSSSIPPSRPSAKVDFSTMKLAKSYHGDSGNSPNMKPSNLSSTLEKLYAWEKKLYKEVKDEERLRVTYEKQCKRLKILDDRGAETSKIDATQASIRKLLTKLNVCIKAVDAISSRIHRLRDEELQPQVTDLIHGLIRMWKAMLKCHQKQFQAIMESKSRSLRANTSSRGDSQLRATKELEMELLAWCSRFGEWINSQKSFIESLTDWLMRCLNHEPEETPDGVVPFSPGRIGAPPIFVVCHDWSQAMENISEKGVANAMDNFASNLRELWDKHDEEQRQRLKAEYLSKDFERRLQTLRMERGRLEREPDVMSDKTSTSIVPSESGVSPLDDLKVDLDSMRVKLKEERARHKEAIKLVHNAASSSLQAGLTPIFEALGNFTSEALKAYEHVRLQNSWQHPGRN